MSAPDLPGLKRREDGRQPPAGVGRKPPLTATLAALVLRVGRGGEEVQAASACGSLIST
jgi:hypothetical protein